MTINRRNVLRAAAAAGALGVAWPLASGLSVAQAQEAAAALGARWDPGPFTLGVGSGDPQPTGVALWTRLAPEPLAPVQPLPDTVEVEWVLCTDQGLQRRVAGGTVAARAAQGYSVHVDVGGLDAGRRYFYGFRALGAASRLGRTRTAPLGQVDRVRFASANCQAFHDGFYAAFRGIAREDVDFVVHLGDYIYEHGKVGGQAVRDHESDEVLSLSDYRRRHALYKGDPSLRDAHAAHPWFITWDDHEVVNDYSGTTPALQRRRAVAYQAWYENMPVRTDEPSSPQIYRDRQWGDLLDLTILDLRQYRSAQNLPDGTILGAAQKSYLKKRIETAGDRWNCWANSIMLSQLAKPGGGYYFTDQWDGFLAERREVLGHVAGTGMPNLVVITGDWHSAFVDDIRPDFDDPASPVIGTEFTAHSVTSGAYSPQWNSENGPVLGAANPHLKYFEGNRYGYDVHELTSRRWTTTMRVIGDRGDPASSVTDLTSFTVERGRAGSTESLAGRRSPAQYRRPV